MPDEKAVQIGDFGVSKKYLINDELYIPNINNIGISMDFDSIPISQDYYKECIKHILKRKKWCKF